MKSKAIISLFQAFVIVLCSIGVYNFVIQDKQNSGSGDIKIIDSTDEEHYFQEPPKLSLIHI